MYLCLYSVFFFQGPVRGLGKIWIIGDNFCEKMYNHFYKGDGPNQTGKDDRFAFANFEMRDFFSSRYSSHNRSTAGRLINCFIRALNKHNTLPKLVVIVMDDDLLMDIPNSNLINGIKNLTMWLLKQFERSLCWGITRIH